MRICTRKRDPPSPLRLGTDPWYAVTGGLVYPALLPSPDRVDSLAGQSTTKIFPIDRPTLEVYKMLNFAQGGCAMRRSEGNQTCTRSGRLCGICKSVALILFLAASCPAQNYVPAQPDNALTPADPIGVPPSPSTAGTFEAVGNTNGVSYEPLQTERSKQHKMQHVGLRKLKRKKNSREYSGRSPHSMNALANPQNIYKGRRQNELS